MPFQTQQAVKTTLVKENVPEIKPALQGLALQFYTTAAVAVASAALAILPQLQALLPHLPPGYALLGAAAISAIGSGLTLYVKAHTVNGTLNALTQETPANIDPRFKRNG